MAIANLQELNTKGLSRSGITQQKLALPIITLITGFLVIAPLLILFRTSFLPPGKLPFDTVEFTLTNFLLAYVNPATLRLLYNTVLYASGSVLLGLVIACVLAWLLERTDLPLRTTIRVMTFAKMPVPPLAFVSAGYYFSTPTTERLISFSRICLD